MKHHRRISLNQMKIIIHSEVFLPIMSETDCLYKLPGQISPLKLGVQDWVVYTAVAGYMNIKRKIITVDKQLDRNIISGEHKQ